MQNDYCKWVLEMKWNHIQEEQDKKEVDKSLKKGHNFTTENKK